MYAVLIPWVTTEYGEALLLEVRSQNVKQPGEICFPGGRCEHGETPEQTAVRETCEELGLKAEDICVISEAEHVITVSGRKGYSVQGRISIDKLRGGDTCEEELGGLKLSRDEVEEAFLLPLEWLRNNPPEFYDLAITEDEELPPKLRGYLANYGEYRRKGTTDYWEYEGHGIWGLTARIIKRLLERLP